MLASLYSVLCVIVAKYKGLLRFAPRCDRNKSRYYYVLTRLDHMQLLLEYTPLTTGGR